MQIVYGKEKAAKSETEPKEMWVVSKRGNLPWAHTDGEISTDNTN